jgi:hypothetical protein
MFKDLVMLSVLSIARPFPFLAGVLTSPRQTFSALGRKPTWLGPVVVAIMLSMVGNAFYYWRVKPDWEQRVRSRIEQHTHTTGETMTSDQVAQQIAAAKFLGKVFILLPVVSIPALCLALSGFYLLAFGLVFMRVPPFKKILSVVAWSEAAIKAVGLAIVVIVLLMLDKETLSSPDLTSAKVVQSSLVAFVPKNISPAIKSLATSVDIFSIWFLVLLTIGFASVAQVDLPNVATTRIAILVFAIWLVWNLIKAGMALGFGY